VQRAIIGANSVATIKIGDLEDMENIGKANKVQLVIGNSHAVDTAERLGTPILRAGFSVVRHYWRLSKKPGLVIAAPADAV